MRSEWRLIAATHNLLKLHSHWIAPPPDRSPAGAAGRSDPSRADRQLSRTACRHEAGRRQPRSRFRFRSPRIRGGSPPLLAAAATKQRRGLALRTRLLAFLSTRDRGAVGTADLRRSFAGLQQTRAPRTVACPQEGALVNRHARVHLLLKRAALTRSPALPERLAMRHSALRQAVALLLVPSVSVDRGQRRPRLLLTELRGSAAMLTGRCG